MLSRLIAPYSGHLLCREASAGEALTTLHVATRSPRARTKGQLASSGIVQPWRQAVASIRPFNLARNWIPGLHSCR